MADLTKNIIFRVGSEMGPGGLASLKAGYDMTMQIAGAVTSYIGRLEELLDVQQNVQIDTSKVTTEVRGLTGSLNMMAAANRLTQAGLKVSGEQFAAITKNAAAFADATGVGTPQALDQLVSALISGNERGMRPFGLELKEGATKTEKIASAIEQLTKRADDLSVGLDTTAEKVDVLKDSFNTMIANMMGYASVEMPLISEAIKFWADTFTDFSRNIESINQSNNIIKLTEQLHELLRVQNEMIESGDLMAAQAMQEGSIFDVAVKLGYRQEIERPVPRGTEYGPTLDQLGYSTPAAKTKGGGGGSEQLDPVQARILMAPTPDEIITTMEASEAANQRYMEMMQVEVDNKLELINIEDEAKRIASENALSYVAYEVDSSISYYRLGAQQRMDILSQAFASGANMMQLSQQLQYQLDADDEKHARKKHQTMKHLWQVGKVATLGQIQIDAARAIMGTWASLSGLGIPGIILAGVMTGFIAITAGLQSAIVAKQSFEGGTNSGGGGTSITAGSLGGGGVGGDAVNYGSGSSSYNQPGASQEQKINITINMGDNAMFLDAVVDANDNASMSGRRHFARVR